MKTPADMYVSLLKSRTVEDCDDSAVRPHEGIPAKSAFRIHGRSSNAARMSVAGPKDGLIRITIEDRDPKRAAELANGYVEEFRKLSASLGHHRSCATAFVLRAADCRTPREAY